MMRALSPIKRGGDAYTPPFTLADSFLEGGASLRANRRKSARTFRESQAPRAYRHQKAPPHLRNLSRAPETEV